MGIIITMMNFKVGLKVFVDLLDSEKLVKNFLFLQPGLYGWLADPKDSQILEGCLFFGRQIMVVKIKQYSSGEFRTSGERSRHQLYPSRARKTTKKAQTFQIKGETRGRTRASWALQGAKLVDQSTFPGLSAKRRTGHEAPVCAFTPG